MMSLRPPCCPADLLLNPFSSAKLFKKVRVLIFLSPTYFYRDKVTWNFYEFDNTGCMYSIHGTIINLYQNCVLFFRTNSFILNGGWNIEAAIINCKSAFLQMKTTWIYSLLNLFPLPSATVRGAVKGGTNRGHPPLPLNSVAQVHRVLNVKGKSFNNTESSYKKFTLMQNIPTIVGSISGRTYFTKTLGLI